MTAINPKLTKRALQGVIIGLGNATPLQVGFSQVALPEEWNNQYQPLSKKYPQLRQGAQGLGIVQSADGSTSMKFGPQQSFQFSEPCQSLFSRLVFHNSNQDNMPRISFHLSSSLKMLPYDYQMHQHLTNHSS